VSGDNNVRHYIGGSWVLPATSRPFTVINPATEEPAGQINLGSEEDVDRAVTAARAAFSSYSASSKEQRLTWMQNFLDAYRRRSDEIARTITFEMGSPLSFSRKVHAPAVLNHFSEAMKVLNGYSFERIEGKTLIAREAIGVCGLITPWNWPLNQLASKLASALAAGCTVVVKPSEIAPLSAVILAEIIHDAGFPNGVFNLVQGAGMPVGNAIASHPDIDMVSFTGSTRSGISVAKAAADTVKRVQQELGGKSAHVILPTADLDEAVAWGVARCYRNSGQSCQAPTRMLVQRAQLEAAKAIAKRTANNFKVGDPLAETTDLGPLASEAQFTRVQRYIKAGMDEGATLVIGGLGRPEGLDRGYYVRPTVFADVTMDHTIAREEIFGPVLSILSYETADEAISIANDSIYGLAGYVHAGKLSEARGVAARLRAGRIYINGADSDTAAPFGGYKQSGNGREIGVFGLEEFLEVKAVLGYGAP
jgi:aldehyde dehydrogenase (NAD+)